MRLVFPLSIVLALAPIAALAQGADMGMFIIGNICLLQNPKYQTSGLGRTYSRAPNFAGWRAIENTPRAICVRSKQWISEQLCSDVLEVVFAKDSTPDDLMSLRKKHATEIQGQKLREAFAYFNKTVGGPEKANAVPCPSNPNPTSPTGNDKRSE